MLASLILSLSLVATAPVAEPVPVLDEDARVEVHYDLAVDLVDEEIDVDMAVDITFTKQTEQDGDRVVRFFMTEWRAFLPSSASGITVSDAEGPLSASIDPVEQPGLVLIRVDFRRDLASGESLDLLVSYSLPSNPPPVELNERVEVILEDQVVVNDAVVAWAFYSDPRADTWTAEFSLPPGFVGPLRDDLWRRRDGTRMLEASGDSFVYDFIVLENDEAMSENVVAFDGQAITVRHWPGDLVWRQRVAEQITGNLPVLIELIGRDWPDRPLVVQQSAQTLGTSYGGWYTGGDNRITIGRSINPELVLHELSHVWFRYDNLADRWLIEGLADEYAALAAHGPTGGDEPEVSLDEAVAFDLADWARPAAVDDLNAVAPEVERWAYQAAWHVTRTTRKTIGVEAFTEATRSILGENRSYPGPADGISSGAERPRSWREFLDLVSEQSDAGGERELAELYAAWVEGEWTDRFEQRSAARRRYLALQERADGAVLPAAVRDPMRDWDFAAADEPMDATERFLDELAVLRAALADHDVPAPVDIDDRFARFATPEEITRYQTELVAAGDNLTGFLERAETLDGRQRIGLIGSDLDARRIAAADAFTAGNLTEAAMLIDEAENLLDEARRRGEIRVVVAGSILSMIVGLLAGRRRRRRARSTVAGSTEPPAPPVTDSTDGSDGYSSSSLEITTSQRS